jgi:ribosomal protein S18 acetylase RimI-like enzyme
MKRPSDQAKLVFLGLLRTVSAFAGTTEPRVVGAAYSSYTASPNYTHNAQTLTLKLRLARRTDVPSIQRCNLATLPENYNAAFYASHLREFPELSLVVVEEEENYDHRKHGLPFSAFPGGGQAASQQSTVVAYVLGKVEEQRIEAIPDEEDFNYWPGRPYFKTQEYGHVTSLAVLDDYRRQGLARQLMEQLHHQLKVHYSRASYVGLHVRQSNEAATGLYGRFGYIQEERIPTYYQDGEDGYYMVKSLEDEQQESANAQEPSKRRLPYAYQPGAAEASAGIFSAWRRPREDYGGFALPRAVGREQPPTDDSDEEPELMSGTL